MLRRTSVALAALVFAGLTLAAPAEEEAKKYAADLKSKDAKVRLAAAKELGRLGGANEIARRPVPERHHVGDEGQGRDRARVRRPRHSGSLTRKTRKRP